MSDEQDKRLAEMEYWYNDTLKLIYRHQWSLVDMVQKLIEEKRYDMAIELCGDLKKLLKKRLRDEQA